MITSVQLGHCIYKRYKQTTYIKAKPQPKPTHKSTTVQSIQTIQNNLFKQNSN